jgi:hypothetical protein
MIDFKSKNSVRFMTKAVDMRRKEDDPIGQET